jgi:type IX secretion system PorP/SprF family membrane protein
VKQLIYILLLSFLLNGLIEAEDFPVFSQYVSNGLLLSPAYTGSREVLSVNLMYRDQWVGFDGAPVYQTLSIHAPLKNAHIGIGFLLLNETSGPTRNTQAYFNYAYRVNLGKGKLAFGLRAGMHFANFNWKNIYLIDPSDPAFSNNNENYMLPNFGAGIYYYSYHAFLGLSVPYFLSYKESASHNGYAIYNDINNYNYMFTAGYLFDISRNFKVKPTTLIKYNSVTKFQEDLNLNIILLNDKLWLGIADRVNQAISYMVEIQFNPQLKLGYSFDYAAGPINYFNHMSHEISLRYEFSYKIKAFNPRYF